MLLSLMPILAKAAIDIDGTVLIQTGAFFFILFFLHFTLFRPYLRTVEAREEETEGAREEAAEVDRLAQARLEEYDEKLAAARREAKNVRETLRNQGTGEQDKMTAEVREEIMAEIREARAEIQGQVEVASARIEERASGLAEAMVDRVVPTTSTTTTTMTL